MSKEQLSNLLNLLPKREFRSRSKYQIGIRFEDGKTFHKFWFHCHLVQYEWVITKCFGEEADKFLNNLRLHGYVT